MGTGYSITSGYVGRSCEVIVIARTKGSYKKGALSLSVVGIQLNMEIYFPHLIMQILLYFSLMYGAVFFLIPNSALNSLVVSDQ